MDADKLHALGAQTDESPDELPPSPEQVAQQRQADADEIQAMEWGGIAYTIGSALGMLAPELKQVYTKEACLNWGRSVVPVSNKYGWGPSAVPEIALFMSTMGLAIPTFFVVRMRLKEGPDKGGGGGPLGAIRSWWRDRVARRAAEVGQTVATAGADHGG